MGPLPGEERRKSTDEKFKVDKFGRQHLKNAYRPGGPLARGAGDETDIESMKRKLVKNRKKQATFRARSQAWDEAW